jgi:ABC-type transport system substrate-binding protein
MPRESDGGFDPRREVRGHGPWMLESFEPSVGMTWVKNPDYYIKDRPFPDRLEVPILPDYAQRLAQFKVGNIHTNVASLADVLQGKQDAPRAVLMQGDNYRASGGGYVTFGWETGSPWADVRLRQALSLTIDREAYADTLENVSAFERAGLDLPIKNNSIVYAGWGPAYLDPDNEREFGATAKFLKMDIEESKKLLSAAGHANGIEFEWVYSSEQYGAEYIKSAQVMAGMFPAAGFRVKELSMPYQAYQNKYSEGTYWDFGGVVHRAGRAWPSIGHFLSAFTNPAGSHYHGASVDGKNMDQGDAKLNDLVQKIIGEFDQKRQNDLIHEVTRYYTGQVYSISRPSNTPGYLLNWPVIGNLGVNSTFVGGAVTDPWLNYWIDATKAPLA